jgi:hypothetical protein
MMPLRLVLQNLLSGAEGASMLAIGKYLLILAVTICVASPAALAWGSRGHRTVAAIAMLLIPEKAAKMDAILAQLEVDGNFVDAASYPDEFIGDHDPGHKFAAWHGAALPDDGTPFVCGECLFKALPAELAIMRQGGGGKGEAVAIAWVLNLVGDLHQPLRMDARLRGGSLFHVSYRGIKACDDFTKKDPKFNLQKVWEDCLVEELAGGRDPKTLAQDILGDIKTYKGRPEIGHASRRPWLAWGTESHALAVSVAFDHLQEGADLQDAYILGDGNGALSVVRRQLLLAGIRLAFLLDQNFATK